MDQFFIRSRLRHQDDWRPVAARGVNEALALARAAFPDEDVEVGGRAGVAAAVTALAGTIGGMVDLRYQHHPIACDDEATPGAGTGDPEGLVLPRGRNERLKLALQLLAEARPERDPRFVGSALGGAFNNWSVITNPGRAWAHGSGPHREAVLAAFRAAAASVLLEQQGIAQGQAPDRDRDTGPSAGRFTGSTTLGRPVVS